MIASDGWAEAEEGSKDEAEGCSSCNHSYCFEEMIPTQEFGRYQERWRCMYCRHPRTLSFDLSQVNSS
jgi:hypothetical protein